MTEQTPEPLAPPVPAPPLTNPQDPDAPSEVPTPMPPQTNDPEKDPSDPPLDRQGEERRGEGGEEGAPLYDGGPVPDTGDETFRTEDTDVLDESHDLEQ